MRTASLFLVIAAAIIAAEPRPSPPFSILRPNQAPIELDSFRGKVVALAFIDTNCPHCQDLTRTMGPISQEYGPKGVQFLECAFNEGAPGLVAGFIKQFQPPFPVGFSYRAAVDAYLQRSVIDTRPLYVPHMVFLDRNGVIQDDYPGESSFMLNPAVNVRAELDKLLAAGAPKATKKRPVTKK
jgi:thiol-disulfide isomerase/thioredoxin